jgi:hypothetical protein
MREWCWEKRKAHYSRLGVSVYTETEPKFSVNRNIGYLFCTAIFGFQFSKPNLIKYRTVKTEFSVYTERPGLNRIIKVLNENFELYSLISLNLTYLLSRPLGATQVKLKSYYSKVPVHIDIIHQPLRASGVDLYGS